MTKNELECILFKQLLCVYVCARARAHARTIHFLLSSTQYLLARSSLSFSLILLEVTQHPFRSSEPTLSPIYKSKLYTITLKGCIVSAYVQLVAPAHLSFRIIFSQPVSVGSEYQ